MCVHFITTHFPAFVDYDPRCSILPAFFNIIKRYFIASGLRSSFSANSLRVISGYYITASIILSSTDFSWGISKITAARADVQYLHSLFEAHERQDLIKMLRVLRLPVIESSGREAFLEATAR